MIVRQDKEEGYMLQMCIRDREPYIPEDVFDEMPERVAMLGQYPRFAGYAAGLNGVTLNRRSVNGGKVTDHHALIVTENLPGELSKDERRCV